MTSPLCKSPDFATQAEQTIQIHNKVFARNEAISLSKATQQIIGTDLANEIASFLAKT